jgi:hypothetical protein
MTSASNLNVQPAQYFVVGDQPQKARLQALRRRLRGRSPSADHRKEHCAVSASHEDLEMLG